MYVLVAYNAEVSMHFYLLLLFVLVISLTLLSDYHIILNNDILMIRNNNKRNIRVILTFAYIRTMHFAKKASQIFIKKTLII